MKKLVSSLAALLLLVSIVAWASPGKPATVTGWVVDDKCGAKGAHAGSEECAKKCLSEGAKMVVVNDSDKELLYVQNPDTLKEQIGQHVTVKGKLDGNKLYVENATAAEAGK